MCSPSTAGPAGHLTDLERGTIAQPEFVTHLATTLGVGPDRLLERIIADLALEPTVADIINVLRRNGIRAAVVSNSWGAGDYDPYATYDLPGRFDVVVLSHGVGYRKPEPEILRIAANRLSVAPADCVFVDDVAAYLAPVEELGITTIHAVEPAETSQRLLSAFKATESTLPQGLHERTGPDDA